MGNEAVTCIERPAKQGTLKKIPSKEDPSYNYAFSRTKQMGPKSLVFSKLGKKDMDEQLDVKTQTEKKITEKKITYKQLEELQDADENLGQAEPKQSEDIQQIKIKWNSFIKMKTKNYLDEYSVVKQIGRGGFGTVSKVVARFTGVTRAAKKIKKAALGKEEIAKLFEEMAIMITLDHPNIARLYEVYDYKSNYVLILELCQGGQLFKKIVSRQLDEKGAASVMSQLFNALQYMHSRGIVHRDLKPENMLFQKNDGNIKLIDFGIAAKLEKGKILTSRIGTPYYIAPQVLLKKYTQKCDIWSAGIILYMMMAQKPPFSGQNEHQVMQNIIKTEPVFKSLKNVPADCIDLMKRMLRKNPDVRISAEQAWSHPWIQKHMKMNPGEKNLDKAINNISTFKFANRFEAVVYTYIVSQIFTSDEKNALKQIFTRLDRNHDGVISVIELKQAIQSQGSMNQERINFLMRMIDTNGSGQIDYTEFIVAALQPEAMNRNHFEQAFSYFDIDHSGVICYEEIAAFMQNKENCEEEIKNIFKEVDENHDGEISKQEFVAVLAHKTKQKIRKLNQESKVKESNKTKKMDQLNAEQKLKNNKEQNINDSTKEKRALQKKSTEKNIKSQMSKQKKKTFSKGKTQNQNLAPTNLRDQKRSTEKLNSNSKQKENNVKKQSFEKGERKTQKKVRIVQFK